MRNALSVGLVFALALGATATPAAAQDGALPAQAVEPWTAEELENLLAPIALYPDPILAQVLIAATFPDQIALAAAYVRVNGTQGIDRQPWEISVKAVAHYPPVLNLMAEGEDWMIALGQAYAEQSTDVMAAVQSLRRMANAQGNLVTTEQQQVIVEREVIRIVPAQPRVIYVPTYDPAVIYFRPVYVVHAHPAYWSWGMGYPIGVWLTYDVDWYGHRVYYHGWHSGGWVVVSRPWIVINPIYISPRHTVIVINRGISSRPFNPWYLRRHTVVHRHATFDRRGRWDDRRDVGRNDRRDDRRDVGRNDRRDDRRDDRPDYDRRNDRRDDRPDYDRRNGRRETPVPTRTVTTRREVVPKPPWAPGTRQATPTPTRRVTPTSAPRRDVTPTSAPRRDVTPTSAPRRDVTPTSAPRRDVTPTRSANPTRTIIPTRTTRTTRPSPAAPQAAPRPAQPTAPTTLRGA
ncbi:MAG: DUF3300 domain-containing protein, partial [Gemmatimonadaceae bacterium]